MIKDKAGKQMEALTVFQITIKYFKDHMYTKITENVKEIDNQICVVYVFTVPANWDYLAVEFMREAAIKVCDSFSVCLLKVHVYRYLSF